jgi:hypothetical protein
MGKTKYTDRWKEDKAVRWDNCFECGSKEDIHYHHVVPETYGGKNTLPLCAICHGKIHKMDFSNKELRMLGIQKAKAEGKYKGRKIGAKESYDKFLGKPKVKEIASLLIEGMGIRKISRTTNTSPNYIYKVKDRLKEIQLT